VIVSIDERSDNTPITTYAEHYEIRRIIVNKVYFSIKVFAVYIRQAKAWGFDGGVLKAKERVQLITASGTEFAKRINVRRLTVIGETIENIDVLCHDLPGNSPIKGLLGLNFLRHFDVNVSFSTGTIELLPR